MNPLVYVSAFTSSPAGRRVYYEHVFSFPDRIDSEEAYRRLKSRFIEDIGKPVEELVILMWRRLE